MKIIKLEETPSIIAGDKTVLKELLNTKVESEIGYSLAHAVVSVGESSVQHRLNGSEVYYILSGKGLMHINAETAEVGPGDVVVIPPNAQQFIENIGTKELVFLAICDPSWENQIELID